MNPEHKTTSITDLNKILEGPNTGTYKLSRGWTWRDRIRCKLFPSEAPRHPEGAPANWQDVLICRTTITLDIIARIRVLISGRIYVDQRTVCENVIGNNKTCSVAYPLPPKWMEPK